MTQILSGPTCGVDEEADEYRTYCGQPLQPPHAHLTLTPRSMLTTPIPANATCPACIEELQARAVEKALDVPPPLKPGEIRWAYCGDGSVVDLAGKGDAKS